MPPKKSKQRGFIGIQRQNMPAVAVVPSAKVSVPAKPVETASKTKLEIPMAASSLEVSTPMVLRSVTQPNPSTSEFCGYEAELEGNRIVGCKGLVRAVSALAVCNGCRAALTVTESLSTRRGLVSRMSLCCSNPECSREALITDPYSKECTDLNTRSVQGMRAIGRGRAGLETFCGMMELLPPVSASNYLVHNSKIATASVEAASENMRAASVHLHHLFSVAPSEILDVAVTCDGTWSKRGFTATYGVVVVISWLTGQVLDYEVLSKRCKVCFLKKQKVSSEEFVEWFEQHKPHCQLNHLGSSPVMEPEGAMRIWNRSEQNLHLRYTSMISDGDCKTHTQLNDLQPYGPDAKVVKHECVGHVEKRMATRLRNLKKTKVFGADGKQLRWGGAGRLTNAFIDQFAQYYGNAIRSHTNDLEGMTEACWAVFYHCSSHNGNPQHDLCPKGPDSWCRCNQAIARCEFDDFPPPHNTTFIPADLAEHVKPIFVSLTDKKLLERCLLGATQNQNESFNSTVWKRAPKTEFVSLDTVEIAVG